MPLVKSITPKKINVLGTVLSSFSILLTALLNPVFSQDNSPYTRYGLGDIVPSTSITNRAMGGISAAFAEPLGVNFTNPASFSSFLTYKEPGAKKMSYGRAVLDIGINVESRTLREPNRVGKFTASNALFSHVQVGLPLKSNWGLSFGLRPVSRISYKIGKTEKLLDPNSGLPIDSAVTLNEGTGGSYLATIGTGFKVNMGANHSIAFGITGGYFFGKKDISVRRIILNDTVTYNSGNFQTITTYGNIYASAGLQYQAKLNKATWLTIGAFGSLKNKLNAKQDIIRETYFYDETSGNVRLDSVSEQLDIKGKIDYPSSFTAGFILEKYIDFDAKTGGWLIGIDYEATKWSDYTFYGQKDPTVKDSWKLKVGAQLRPFPKKNYFSNVAYRAGAFIGSDYIYVQKELPLFGVSVGMGLPIVNTARLNNAQSILNVSLEFIKRGNNDNLLKENQFRLSFGMALTDIWFVKKKYE
jgi:hypothetical protein